MRRKQTPQQATDHATIRAGLDRDHATRVRQLTAARAELAQAEQDRDAAQQRRDADRVSALADADPAARERYAQASADVRGIEDRAAELTALIAQLEAAIETLATAQEHAQHAEARTQMAALAPVAIAAAGKMGVGLAMIAEARGEHRAARLQMLEIGARAGLPDAELRPLHDYRHVVRKVTWELGTIGLMPRPIGGRYMADLDLIDLERQLLTGEPVAVPDDDTDDEASAA